MNKDLDIWDELLSAAARLQLLLEDAVLVGGTASALYAKHRLSTDADHVLENLSADFDNILEKLESVAGWKTARIKKPVLILGSLDGIETGIRQLIRSKPLETKKITVGTRSITVPTPEEILRIKAVLILKRNATRDYVDFAALAHYMDVNTAAKSLSDFDSYYPPENNQSPLQQLIIQLSKPIPYDLEGTDLSEYKNLDTRWHNFAAIEKICRDISALLLDT